MCGSLYYGWNVPQGASLPVWKSNHDHDHDLDIDRLSNITKIAFLFFSFKNNKFTCFVNFLNFEFHRNLFRDVRLSSNRSQLNTVN